MELEKKCLYMREEENNFVNSLKKVNYKNFDANECKKWIGKSSKRFDAIRCWIS